MTAQTERTFVLLCDTEQSDLNRAELRLVPQVDATENGLEVVYRKRPSFMELAPDRFRFLVEEEGFTGPELQAPGDRIPATQDDRTLHTRSPEPCARTRRSRC